VSGRNAIDSGLQHAAKELVSQFSSGSFETQLIPGGIRLHIAAFASDLQVMQIRQRANELLVGVRLCSSELVIEMNNRKDGAKFVPQFEHQPQQRNRVSASRNRNRDAVPSANQFVLADVTEH
jgi:hypothetical protein